MFHYIIFNPPHTPPPPPPPHPHALAQRVALAREQFDGLQRLQRPDNARHGAQHAVIGAAVAVFGFGRHREEAAVAGACSAVAGGG